MWESFPTAHQPRFEQKLPELKLRDARITAWFVMILVPLCWSLFWMKTLSESGVSRMYRAQPPLPPRPLAPVLLPAMTILSGDPGSGRHAQHTISPARPG
jgi:hypothetical protein